MKLTDRHKSLMRLVRLHEKTPGPPLTFRALAPQMEVTASRVHQLATDLRYAGLLGEGPGLYTTSEGRRVRW